ncbi:hypothetical protein AB0P40_15785 [Streptomyces sp. NPDC079189]|uniref:hypothetical protein n=1 Tax=unclassified Streptomyces TaxID=2593676 RepID=UPI0033B90E89
MSVPTLEPTARKRLRRTRTRTVSARPALAVSTLRPHQFDLRPTCVSLVCPDCMTWCPITGAQTHTPKLVPHHAEPAGTEDPRRCLGSNRHVVIDVTLARWARRLEDGVAETNGRRATSMLRKPKTAVTPAITQILAPVLDAPGALKLYRAHCKQCTVCHESGHAHCADGSPLVRLYLYKLRTTPAQGVLTFHEQLEREEDRREQGLWILRELRWASTAATVRQADIQRVHDQLMAVKLQNGPHLDRFERADLDGAIKTLEKKLKNL